MTIPACALPVVPPEDALDVREGLEEAARGEGILLTREQLERWAATGEWAWESDVDVSPG